MMMNRAFKQALFILIFTGMNFTCIVLAEGNSAGQLINRPQVKYESGQLRDPFQPTWITAGKLPVDLAQSKLDFSALVVQGIIWGGRVPQAIINNKVLAEGDLIDGAKIFKIDKSGITLSVSGGVINLLAPGYEKTFKKDNEYGVTSGMPMNMQMSSTSTL